MWPLPSRNKHTPETLWAEVRAAAKALDAKRLRLALATFRTKDNTTRINDDDRIFSEAKQGNSFAVAMKLLVATPVDTPGVTETAEALLDDWQYYGTFKPELLRHARYNRFSQYVADIIKLGAPDRILLALRLCNDYLTSNASLQTGEKPAEDTLDWGWEALSLPHNRIECLSALTSLQYTSEQVLALVTKGLEDNKSNLPRHPTLDKATLQAVLKLHSKTSDDRWYQSYNALIIERILEFQPQKSLLEAIWDYPSCFRTANFTDLCDYLGRNRPPNRARLAEEQEYRGAWEDLRLGILTAYRHLRPLAEQHPDLCTSLDNADRVVLGTTGVGLKERVSTGEHPTTDPAARGVMEELRLYQQTGLLPELFTHSGTASGFTSDLDYKTTLREHILPNYFSGERREHVMEKTCWAEYVRTKPLEHAGSATVAYLHGEKSLW